MENILLNLPYISQIDHPAALLKRNDCGPACCWMLLSGYHQLSENETVDFLYQSVVPSGDRYTSWKENIKILNSHSLYPQYRWNIIINDLQTALQQGFPIMVLINYGVLSIAFPTESTFMGNHFMLVVGINQNNVIVHDPLWRKQGGKNIQIPIDLFYSAWKSAEGISASGLIMTKKLNKQEQILAVGNVISQIGLNLRLGAGINHKLIGRLNHQKSIQFAEIITKNNQEKWGRLRNTKLWCAIKYQNSTLVLIEQKKISTSTLKEKITESLNILQDILNELA